MAEIQLTCLRPVPSTATFSKTLQSMLRAHPEAAARPYLDVVAATLEALVLCELVCVTCADACLSENSAADLRGCIQLNLDCAAICAATGKVLLRRTETSGAIHAQLHACLVACQACADECGVHASHHRHCAICAQTCHRCQEKCNLAMGELSSAGVVMEA